MPIQCLFSTYSSVCCVPILPSQYLFLSYPSPPHLPHRQCACYSLLGSYAHAARLKVVANLTGHAMDMQLRCITVLFCVAYRSFCSNLY